MSHPTAEPAPPRSARGDADIAAIGALVADPGRCRILLALDDGRALPASRLAAEAGVSPATASSHLRKLTAAGLLTVEAHGRNRYYRLTGPAVGHLIDVRQQLAPAAPVRSLRQGTRAQALREVGRAVVDAGWAGVFGMATLPEARGRGAARSILASLADWATAQGADGMYLQVESDDDPALHLYDRTCFTKVCGYHYRTGSPSPRQIATR